MKVTFDRQQISGIPFVGIITADLDLVEKVTEAMSPRLGKSRSSFTPMPFIQSDYYRSEMGDNLMRTWLSFEKILGQDELIWYKLEAMDIEARFLNERGGRKVNVDPGLLTLNNLILTTRKNAGHRIYLGDGVFVELTLVYQSKRFQPLPWTYPDYQQPDVLIFFGDLRNELKSQLRSGEADV